MANVPTVKHIILGCKIKNNQYNTITPVVIFTSDVPFTVVVNDEQENVIKTNITGQNIQLEDLHNKQLTESPDLSDVNLLVVPYNNAGVDVHFVVCSNLSKTATVLSYNSSTIPLNQDGLTQYFQKIIDKEYDEFENNIKEIYNEIKGTHGFAPDTLAYDNTEVMNGGNPDKGKEYTNPSMKKLYTLITTKPIINNVPTMPIKSTIYDILYDSITYMISSLSIDTLKEIGEMEYNIDNSQNKFKTELDKFIEFSYVTFTTNDISDDVWKTIIAQCFNEKELIIFNKDIAKDKTNYINYGKEAAANEPQYVLHVTRFLDLISKLDTIPMSLNNIHEKYHISIYSKFILKIYEKFQYIVVTFIKSFAEFKTKAQNANIKNMNLINFLEAKVTDAANSTIITYLKINNTEGISDVHKKQFYNQRFHIELKQESSFDPKTSQLTKHKSTSLKLGYNDDEFAYYKTDNGSNNCNPNIDILNANNTNKKFILLQVKNATSLTCVNTYKYKYTFGKFTEIFPYHKPDDKDAKRMTNKDISEKMNAVIQQLRLGKPVFIIGYGASGAGKTSALINFKNEEGILIELCKQLTTIDFPSNKKLTKIGIIVKEYYVDYTQDANYNEYIYTLDNGNFNYNKTVSPNSTSKDGTNEAVNAIQAIHKYRTAEDFDPNGKTMGELLIRLVDTDRLVKATTNNPQSSRSHVLVFVKLYTDNDVVGNLIVGDFAGVENKFQCQDPSTLQRFLNVPSEDPSKDKKPFYSTLVPIVGGSSVDPKILDPNTTVTSINKTDSVVFKDNVQCKLDYIMNPNPIYDFTFDKLMFRDDNTGKDLKDKYSNKYQTVISGVLTLLLPDYSNELDTTDVYTQLLDSNIKKTVDEKYQFIIAMKSNLENNNSNPDAKMKEILKQLVYKHILLPSGQTYDDKFIQSYNTTFAEIIRFNYANDSNSNSICNNLVKNKKLNLNNNEKYITKSYKNLLTNIPLTCNSNSSIWKNRVNLGSVVPDYYKKIQKSNDNLVYAHNYFILNTANKKTPQPTYIKEHNIFFDTLYTNIMNSTASKFTFYVIVPNDTNSKDLPVPIELEMTLEDISKLFMEKKYPVFKHVYDSTGKTDPIAQLKHTLNHLYGKKDNNTDTDTDTDIDNFISVSAYMYNIIQETICRLQYGQFICNNRLKEGVFINSTLATIRKTIQTIITKKKELSNSIMHSPNIVHECLETYCPSGQNCFAMPKTTDESSSGTLDLITEIYNTIGSSTPDNPSLDKFYEDITICLFGVFNVSRCANNPPPIQYIDINRLKQMVYYNKEFTDETIPILKQLYSDIRRFKMTDLDAYKFLRDDFPVDLLDDFEIIPIKLETGSVKHQDKSIRKEIQLTFGEHTLFTWVTIRGTTSPKQYNNKSYLEEQKRSPGKKDWTETDVLNRIENEFKLFTREKTTINKKRKNIQAWGKIGDTVFVKYNDLPEQTLGRAPPGEQPTRQQTIKPLTKQSTIKSVPIQQPSKPQTDAKYGILIGETPSVETNNLTVDDLNNPNLVVNCKDSQCKPIKKVINDVIENIDISNAASAVGVLEFLDQMAKFTSSRTLCLTQNNKNTCGNSSQE